MQRVGPLLIGQPGDASVPGAAQTAQHDAIGRPQVTEFARMLADEDLVLDVEHLVLRTGRHHADRLSNHRVLNAERGYFADENELRKHANDFAAMHRAQLAREREARR